jgi:hypothetical protein
MCGLIRLEQRVTPAESLGGVPYGVAPPKGGEAASLRRGSPPTKRWRLPLPFALCFAKGSPNPWDWGQPWPPTLWVGG